MRAKFRSPGPRGALKNLNPPRAATRSRAQFALEISLAFAGENQNGEKTKFDLS
jgi:hypothetical protein